MDNFYRKIIEPILGIDSNSLRKSAWVLENYQPKDDDNLFKKARMESAEVLNRVARLQDFTAWVLSDNFEKDLEDGNL